MKLEELEALKKRIEDAEWRVIISAKDVVDVCAAEEIEHYSLTIHAELEGLKESVENLKLVMKDLPPPDTKIEP